MWVFETIVAAFSMFSALPMPHIQWNQKNMRYMLCAFPLVGAVIGGLCWLWSLVVIWLSLPLLLRGLGLFLIPVIVTGGIHLDGYCDTCDALASHGTQEQRHKILKDSRMGAFAAIRLGCWLLTYFVLFTTLPTYLGGVVLLSFCLSRSLSGLSVASFPLAKDSGLAHTFAQAADKRQVRIILLVLALILSVVMTILTWQGAVMAATAWLMYAYYHYTATKKFGGLSGDLAGWFLEKAELWMLLALCLVQYLQEVIR